MPKSLAVKYSACSPIRKTLQVWMMLLVASLALPSGSPGTIPQPITINRSGRPERTQDSLSKMRETCKKERTSFIFGDLSNTRIFSAGNERVHFAGSGSAANFNSGGAATTPWATGESTAPMRTTTTNSQIRTLPDYADRLNAFGTQTAGQNTCAGSRQNLTFAQLAD
jgi:hypothetical protein